MREIKFRAWNKKQRVMVYDNEDDSEDYWDGVCASVIGLINFQIKYIQEETGAYEVMQYIGQKDKNKKMIFEGDIVTSIFYPFQNERKYNYHGVIEWDDDSACYVVVKHLVNGEKRGISDGMADNYDSDYEFEVIGNIYENPELLEGEPDAN